jgi:hypothetical protein
MTIALLLCFLLIFQTRNLFFAFFIGIVAIGGIMNIIAVASNDWKMPSYLPRKNLPQCRDDIHLFFNDIRKVNKPYLCDIIGIYYPRKKGILLTIISIGDVLIAIGLLIGIAYLFWEMFL